MACMVLFSTCQKDHLFDCLTSTGKTINQLRSTGNFSKVELHNSIDLIIYPVTLPFIQVSAGEHLIEGIITELQENTLYIRNENKCNWVRSFENKYTVKIGVQSLDDIEYHGSGNIHFMDTIKTNDFIFNSWNGSGSTFLIIECATSNINNNAGRPDIHVSGISGVSYVYNHDVSSIDASDLISGFTFMRNSSTGDCRVYVTKELEAEIVDSGDIYYKGNPYKVSRTGAGSGKLMEE